MPFRERFALVKSAGRPSMGVEVGVVELMDRDLLPGEIG